ncbi:MAG: hypothetical protein ACD_20C00202G0003 [uncultured bacterium]|nr:MAG: hypothetical protein ACD_20C00202G0003 [uncultured bacterium]
MKFSRSISLSIIVLLVFVTLMAAAGIRGFLRLAPSIEQINSRNTQSLYLTEKMMSTLALERNIDSFEIALKQAKENITEVGEAEKIHDIELNYKTAFAGDRKVKEQIINDITELSEINRIAMKNAALKAEKLSSVGSWVITFMGLIVWALGLVILNTLQKTVINPLTELKDVFQSQAKGNTLRRCPKIAPTKDFQIIYDGLNSLLDKVSMK